MNQSDFHFFKTIKPFSMIPCAMDPSPFLNQMWIAKNVPLVSQLKVPVAASLTPSPPLCGAVLHCTVMYCTAGGGCYPGVYQQRGAAAGGHLGPRPLLPARLLHHLVSSHCTVLYCTVLYCTVLYCTGQQSQGSTSTTSSHGRISGQTSESGPLLIVFEPSFAGCGVAP